MSVKLMDVANAAGVGYGTASRAISGNGAIDQATKAKALAAAERLGYRTHAAARALRERRSRTVGLIVPDLINEFYTASADVLQQHLDRNGYQLLVSTTHNDLEQEAVAIKTMLERQVDAVVHVPVNPESQFPSGLPVIELNRHGSMSRPAVISDDAEGVSQLTQHLIDSGYTDIAAISGPDQFSTSRSRLRGFLTAVERAGLSSTGSPRGRYRVAASDFSSVGGAQSMTDLLANDRPQALIALSTRIALGALRASLAAGLDIPNDIAFAAYGEAEWFEVWRPGITCFAPALAQMGQATASLTIAALDGEPIGDEIVRVPGTVIVRGTTPPVSH